MLNDNTRRLLDEIERVVCVREHMRRHWVANPPKSTTDEENRMRQLCTINQSIATAKDAVIDGSITRAAAALGETKRHP